MCLVKDHDGLLLEFEGATIAAVKRDICAHHSGTPDQIHLYALSDGGMQVDAMLDDAAVGSMDVFYMIVNTLVSDVSQSVGVATPTSLSDVTRTLQAYNEALLSPVRHTVPVMHKVTTTLSPVSGHTSGGSAGTTAVLADSFCFI